MKIVLVLFILLIAISAQAQINQKTASLRKQYPLLHSFELKEVSVPPFERNFMRHGNETMTTNLLSSERLPKPSTHSIQQAFNYYNSVKKQADYSAFLMMGYSLMTNRNVIYLAPQESLRFFPGNSHN